MAEELEKVEAPAPAPAAVSGQLSIEVKVTGSAPPSDAESLAHAVEKAVKILAPLIGNIKG